MAVGSLIATGSPSQAGWGGGRPFGGTKRSHQLRIAADVGGGVAFEDDGLAKSLEIRLGAGGELAEINVALFVGEPGDLEGAVPFDQPAGVIVDRFARPAEQPSGGVVVAENKLRIG